MWEGDSMGGFCEEAGMLGVVGGKRCRGSGMTLKLGREWF